MLLIFNSNTNKSIEVLEDERLMGMESVVLALPKVLEKWITCWKKQTEQWSSAEDMGVGVWDIYIPIFLHQRSV